MELQTRRFDGQLLIVVGIATLFGFLLRIYPPGALGFNQFDEGIYAMVASWAFRPEGIRALDPMIIPYAPPGYPVLVGVLAWLIGSTDQAGFIVSALTGTATIPVVSWVAHRIFGRSAAAVAAWCIGCSGPHIAFSRMGLVDVSFLLCWAMGLAITLSFVRMPGAARGIALGCMVGLAQQFKYNGWLLGGFAIAAVVLGAVISRDGRQPAYLARLAGWGGLSILIAGMVVWPWYNFVEHHGGYSALLMHQRSYLGGLDQWLPHLRSQLDQAATLSGPAWLGVVNALAVVISLCFVATTEDRTTLGGMTRALLIGGFVWAIAAATLTTGLLACMSIIRWRQSGDRLLGVGWLGFILLAPFYHPYARLWLPGELYHWIFLGGIARYLAHPPGLESGLRFEWGRCGHRLWLPALILAGFFWSGPGFPFAKSGPIDRPGLFAPSDSLRIIAGEVALQLPPRIVGLRTLIRPAMSYYLSQRVALQPQSDLDALRVSADGSSWALVDSTILSARVDWHNPADARSVIRPLLDRWEVVATMVARNSLPTTLDLDPMNPGRYRDDSSALFWLLRKKPVDSFQ